MARLPGWVDQALRIRGVKIERYGRGARGAPTTRERQWFFCGWYWHIEAKGYVVGEPRGPFPCPSAAAADAIGALRVPDQGRAVVIPIRRRA